MTKLTSSKKHKDVSAIGSIILIVLICGSTSSLVLQYPKSICSWVLFSILLLPGFVIASVILRVSFCHYISFDDEKGLEYYDGIFRKKCIPISSLESVLFFENGISIGYKDIVDGTEKLKKLNVPVDFEDIEIFAEWLDSHARNLNEERTLKVKADFEKENSDLSEGEWVDLIKRLLVIGRVMTWLGIAIAIFCVAGIFFNNTVEKISLLLCVAYPIIIIVSLRLSHGHLMLCGNAESLYPTMERPFFSCVCVLAAIGFIRVEYVYEVSKVLKFSFLLTVVFLVLYYFCASENERKLPEKLWEKILVGVMGLFLFFGYGFGTTVNINSVFDKSTPQVYEATVLSQRKSSGKHTSYYLTVSPWIDGMTEQKEVSVGSTVYKSVNEGDVVLIRLHDGKLGIPWFSVGSANK